MKKTILATSIAVLGAHAGIAAAQQAYGDFAKVVSATPVRETVTESRRECRVEQVSGYQERREAPSGAGAVVGAIVGGVIGHQFGNSTGGRDHGTAAGAVVGGLIGNQVEKDSNGVERRPVARELERCRFVPETRERVVGYDVSYQYNGRDFRARMAYDPGPEMPVNVEVRPPADPRASAYGPTPPTYRY
jgi:uncharacterized protein YcfJ